MLQRCEVSGKRVLPIGLERCTITGKRALKRYLVSSSLSGSRLLEAAAVRSAAGQHCSPTEAKICVWSGRKSHPDDLRKCELTGLPIHFEFATTNAPHRLAPLNEMLAGLRRNADEAQRWPDIAERIAATNGGGKYSIEAAQLSPDQLHLAICSEHRTLFGMRNYQVGALYEVASGSIIGRICTGKRGRSEWTERAQ